MGIGIFFTKIEFKKCKKNKQPPPPNSMHKRGNDCLLYILT